ncbi:MAG: hypothetical protein ACYC8T_08170 [Myxococcaceae bacterium]
MSLAALGQSARVALRWRPVTGAQSYQLQVAKDPAFKSVVLDKTLAEPGYRWEELPTVTYYWRVRTIDAENRQGEWSSPQPIAAAVGPPEISSPADGAGVLSGEGPPEVEVTLEPSRLLKSYSVELARDARFSDVVGQKIAPGPALRVPAPDTGTFFLRAGGVDLSGRSTGPGPARKVVVSLGPPRALRPAARLVWAAPPPAVPLEWSALGFARGYRVELTREGGATSRFEARRPRLDFTPPGLGGYGWRVAGVDARGTLGRWSEVAALHVTLPPPVLEAPAASASFRRRGAPPPVALSWAPVPAAVGYRVELAADPAFTAPAVHLAAAPPLTLEGLAPGEHHWRVSALDPAGNASPPSEARLFVAVLVPPLGVPVTTAPAEEAVVAAGPVGLSWGDVAEAASYEVELDGAAPRSAADPSLPLEGLAEGEHRVRVRARDADGVEGGWSSPVGFFFGTPPTVRAEVEPERSPLVADGESNTLVRVRLFDKKGRPVRGVRLEGEVGLGRLQPLVEDQEGYLARYVAPDRVPDSGADPLTLKDREFRLVFPLPLIAPGHRLGAGARVGWSSNFGSLSTPYVAGDFTVRTPLLRDRVLASVRVGYLGTSGELAVPGLSETVRTRTTVVPVSVLAVYEHPFGATGVYGGLGPSLVFTSVSVGEAFETAPIPGVQLVAGVSRPLGPGVLSGELGYAHGTLSNGLARLRAGGGSISFGYRFDL